MLQTALCEVEVILNDRPISNVLIASNNLELLGLNHLLQLKTKPLCHLNSLTGRTTIPETDGNRCNTLLSCSGKNVLRIPVTHAIKAKVDQTKKNLKVNNITVIEDETAPKNSLPLRLVIICQGPMVLFLECYS